MTAQTRRQFLAQLGCSAGVLAGLAGRRPAGADSSTNAPPNVLLFITDDHGSLDLNAYGSSDLFTPHLDALAQRGVRFTQFYDAAPLCSPSRGAILTGRYPQNNGVDTNGKPFREGEMTIAEMLKRAGYRTGQFGKWHIGNGHPTEPYAEGVTLPNDEGFDYSFGFLGGCIDKWSHFSYSGAEWGAPPQWHDLHRNGEEVFLSGRHSGDLISEEAIRFIESGDTAPFFMYVAFGSPHYPMQPYDKYLERYKDMERPRREYAALVSTVDEQIGQIVGAVDRAGLREHTLIIFLSDHGHSTEARANFGGGNAGPYRGAKFSLFEGGIRVPAIVSMPGRIPEGEVRGALATSMDILPTIAEFAGSPLPDRPMDGYSLGQVLNSGDAPSPHGVCHWMLRDQWAVRDGDWKLIVHALDSTDGRNVVKLEEPFLANLAADVSEQKNLAGDHPDIVQRLTDLHAQWEAALPK